MAASLTNSSHPYELTDLESEIAMAWVHGLINNDKDVIMNDMFMKDAVPQPEISGGLVLNIVDQIESIISEQIFDALDNACTQAGDVGRKRFTKLHELCMAMDYDTTVDEYCPQRFARYITVQNEHH